MKIVLGITTYIACAGICAFANCDPSVAGDWVISGTILTPERVIADGAVTISGVAIKSVSGTPPAGTGVPVIKTDAIILPGFIDLHNHLSWNVLPRWTASRRFTNRYEWQDTAEYDRTLVAPHSAVLTKVGCEAEIYAEVKALVGGATSVVGSLMPDKDHPDNRDCSKGLARNLDIYSELPVATLPPNKPCRERNNDEQLADVVDYEVFPLEVQHNKLDFLRCALEAGELRALIVHLSEGAPDNASARREFRMLNSAGLIQPGLVIVHGTALRAEEFQLMGRNKVGLVWSPRSNDELYGATTNTAAALQAGVPIAVAPDWSPTGSAGMLQEIGYVARRYKLFTPERLVSMATSVPAQLSRLNEHIGSLSPGMLADLIVVRGNTGNPFQAVVQATPADVMLVMVGGQALYGDAKLLARLVPRGMLESISVCGSKKAVYLGNSDAAARGETLAQVQDVLNAALEKAGSRLPAIECD